MDVSKVAVVCPKCGKATKVGYEVVDGKKVRFAKRTGSVIN